jgi:hypothetical protein
MRLHDFLRYLNDRSADCVRNQKNEGLKGAAVKEPDVTFFDTNGIELEVVSVEEEANDVVVEFRRAV